MTYKTLNTVGTGQQTERFHILLDWGALTEAEFRAAETAAMARGMELESVLVREFGVPKKTLLAALAQYYQCPSVEYDERMPIPPELLAGLDGERLSLTRWFPLIHDGNTVIIAACDPQDSSVFEEVKRSIRAERYEFWVTLDEDIQWFIQDYLHARPGLLIGTERTGLAYWRNTMAHWRTRLACYRNDLAQGRTDLAILRWGLGFIALSDVLMRTRPGGSVMSSIYWLMIAAGAAFGVFGLSGYLRVRRTRMRTPGHHTLVEVTSATMLFLENYHDLRACTLEAGTKGTMLARLGDCIGGYSTILYPSPASRERTHLARERNVLAAQRTIAATYRTIYARARTGLAFIRTGVAFTSLGFGLLHYFSLGILTLFDVLLVASGLMMAVDGFLWYLPVRKEQAEVPRCPVPM
jgi:uncharacterized membrane protein YidH (DUF202 family)